MNPADTIAAISSAARPSARIVVRCSGPDAIRLAGELACEDVSKAGAYFTQSGFRGLRCPTWVYTFAGPHSYTGEDSVEFHVPGNPLLARMLLETLLAGGARLAEPGEFTARAYFSGKLDLTEAEGVAATIGAQSEREHAAARRLMAGELSRRVAPAADALAETLALVEVAIDFSEDDVTVLSAADVRARIDVVRKTLSDLVDQSSRFEPLTHEPTVVLAGRPNAGKSTLLNALARTERAVVSPVAGTTRDAIWSHVTLPRGVVRLTDVAGFEDTPVGANGQTSNGGDSTPPAIASQMREHAISAVKTADVLLLVVDANDPRPRLSLPRDPDLIVHTKIDLLPVDGATPRHNPGEQIEVSCIANLGLDRLKEAVDRLCFGDPSAAASLALNARHLHAIDDAQQVLQRAEERANEPPELLAVELRHALDALGRISGRVTPDDLLGRIFASFCIGK